MQTAFEVQPVAKDKPYLSVKIDADTYRMVRIVAAWNDTTIAEYLSGILNPIVKKDFDKLSIKKPPEPK